MKIGVTMGDPLGIGPELVVATWAPDTITYGDRARLRERGLPDSAVVVDPGVRDPGRAQVAFLEAAIADARAGKLTALVTAPIHKAAAIAAGFAFPGHTELLAERFGGVPVTMMFAGPRMRVSLATIHCALAEVPRRLTVDGLRGTIARTADALIRDFGIARPRIAVAGLNPHAGESGHFGDEEARIVAPAVAGDFGAAIVTGPHVPDAVFRAHLDGAFDAVVALYHDQGLIPVKVVDFEEAVNVTLGLPIVRTSPDHGTARDIAGTGRARPTSFAAALRLARVLASRRNP